jgi:hypothetical protein
MLAGARQEIAKGREGTHQSIKPLAVTEKTHREKKRDSQRHKVARSDRERLKERKETYQKREYRRKGSDRESCHGRSQ